MRVMTLNIWNYNRPWPVRRGLIAELIRVHGPDVVALQETRHDRRFERGKGQGDQLAELTGYEATFGQGQVYLPFSLVDEGVTTLTRVQPRRVLYQALTMRRGDRHDENQRLCLGVVVECDGVPVAFYNTHFSLSAAARLDNAIEVSRFIQRETSDTPAILMGDLNAEPDEAAIRFLTGREGVGAETGDFEDCWTSARPGDDGYTYSSFHPVRRIDYMLARNLPVRATSIQTVGGESRDGIYPSDHLGILADIAVPVS